MHNSHIIGPDQLRELSGKRTASAVRRWASSQGIQTIAQAVITQKGVTRLAILLARNGLLPRRTA